MTVYENMEFGLKCHKVAFKKLNENGNEVIEYRKLTKEEIKEKKQKIIAKLLSRGYSYQDVSSLWKEFYE